MSLPSIPEFYAGRSIFITGGTGFMGKVLIEKLLRKCPKLSKIYIIVRPKHNMDVQERIQKLTSQKLFDRIKSTAPEQLEKIIPISGDILSPNLGISQKDLAEIKGNVSIIFHSAATVKFNEHFRKSIKINVEGTLKLLEIAHDMPNLLAFVHVSTAYSNCERSHVEEKIYPMKIDPKKLMDTIEWMDDDLVEKVTPGLLGDKPNTYTFTKAMAEELINGMKKHVPVVIVRPSIVTASYRDPVPGWIDNYNTITGAIISIHKGVLRTVKLDENHIVDIVPVDLCVNAFISSAWHCALTKPSYIPIYHLTTGDNNSICWKVLKDNMSLLSKYPLESFFRTPSILITNSSLVYAIIKFIHHTVPAYLVDFFTRMTRISFLPPGLTALKVYERLDNVMGVLTFFQTREWLFETGNQLIMQKDMSTQDLQEFNYNPKEIDWNNYLLNYVIGIKKFMMKEDLHNLPNARRILKLRYALECAVNITMMLCLWKILACFSPVQDLSDFFMKVFNSILSYFF